MLPSWNAREFLSGGFSWHIVNRLNFSGVYSCFSTIDSFRFEEIVSGNGAFQEI